MLYVDRRPEAVGPIMLYRRNFGMVIGGKVAGATVAIQDRMELGGLRSLTSERPADLVTYTPKPIERTPGWNAKSKGVRYERRRNY